MEELSKVIKKVTLPLEVKIQPFMRDHCIEGRAVLPAVESCQILAKSLQEFIPNAYIYNIANAAFDKFLAIRPDQDSIKAFNEIEVYEDGTVVSKLLSKIKSEKSGITRTVLHAKLEFRKKHELQELTYDAASCLDGICFKIASSDIYQHLVPFGTAYRNLTGNIYITPAGAIGSIAAPPFETRQADNIHSINQMPLGLPFVFDAALHAACVWSQRNHNTTVFPAGFKRRVILRPVIQGENYFSKVMPKRIESGKYYFDIWIYDDKGNLREAGLDVKFLDVTSGRMKLPEWMAIKEDSISLKNIPRECEAFTVVELESVMPFADKALSEEELQRLQPMKWKRRDSYISARLACKLLSRKLAGAPSFIPASEIITIVNNLYPACPLPDGTNPFKCSVSHDSRFAIAAASKHRLGIDVEEISARVLEISKMYLTDKEKELINSLDFKEFDKIEACLRVWSIKEAITKALDIGLSESWNKAQVNHIGKDISMFIMDGKMINAYHDTINNHLFTLVVLK